MSDKPPDPLKVSAPDRPRKGPRRCNRLSPPPATIRPVVLADLSPSSHGGSSALRSLSRARRHLRAVCLSVGIGRLRLSRITPAAIASGLKLPRPVWRAIVAAVKCSWPGDPSKPLAGCAAGWMASIAPDLVAATAHVAPWKGAGQTWASACPSSLPTLAKLVAWAQACNSGRPDQVSPTAPRDPGAS